MGSLFICVARQGRPESWVEEALPILGVQGQRLPSNSDDYVIYEVQTPGAGNVALGIGGDLADSLVAEAELKSVMQLSAHRLEFTPLAHARGALLQAADGRRSELTYEPGEEWRLVARVVSQTSELPLPPGLSAFVVVRNDHPTPEQLAELSRRAETVLREAVRLVQDGAWKGRDEEGDIEDEIDALRKHLSRRTKDPDPIRIERHLIALAEWIAEHEARVSSAELWQGVEAIAEALENEDPQAAIEAIAAPLPEDEREPWIQGTFLPNLGWFAVGGTSGTVAGAVVADSVAVWQANAALGTGPIVTLTALLGGLIAVLAANWKGDGSDEGDEESDGT